MTRDQCGLLIGALIAIAIFASISSIKRDPDELASDAQAAITKNVANEGLLRRTGAEQARFLGEAIGPSCRGRAAFFMGLDGRKIGHWSVRCADGREFMVNVHPDRLGTTSKLECGVLHALKTGMICFKSLNKTSSSSTAD